MAAKMEVSSNVGPSVKEKAVFSILRFLEESLNDEDVSDESKESIEVAMECLQAVFEIRLDELGENEGYKDLPSLQELIENSLSDTDKQTEAEKLKNEGNTKLKNEEYNEAISLYTRAIQLSPSNPPYYANRAAAYIKIEELQKALEDCKTAVRLKPDYARAHGRMGLIYSKLSRVQEAREAYQKAHECDPDNLEYKAGLQALRDAPPTQPPSMPGGGAGAGGGGQPPFDLNNLLSNPGFMNLASSVMSNPMFQNMATRMFQQQAPPPGQPPPSGQAGGEGVRAEVPPPPHHPGGPVPGGPVPGGPIPGGPPPGLLGMNFATMMYGPHLAEMGRQMQENDPVAFEDLRRRAAAQFAATHDDEPTPRERDQDK